MGSSKKQKAREITFKVVRAKNKNHKKLVGGEFTCIRVKLNGGNGDGGRKPGSKNRMTLEKLSNKVDGLATGLTKLSNRVDNLTTNLNTLVNRVDDLTTNMDKLSNRVDNLTTNLNAVTNNLDKLAKIVADGFARQEVFNKFIQKEVSSLRNDVSTLGTNFNKIVQLNNLKC